MPIVGSAIVLGMRAPPATTRLHEIPSRAMSRAASIGRGLLVERLAERGLRLGHYATLETLDAQPGCAQRDVSDATGHDPSDIVALVDDLSALGFVVREVDATDRRRRALTLTADGRAALDWCREQVTAATEEFLSPLDPQERHLLLGLLARLTAGHGVADDPGSVACHPPTRGAADD
jgi:MarR family transcriptional regulator, lower aerobic nicotinate degradation pathway regulator